MSVSCTKSDRSVHGPDTCPEKCLPSQTLHLLFLFSYCSHETRWTSQEGKCMLYCEEEMLYHPILFQFEVIRSLIRIRSRLHLSKGKQEI